MTKMGGQWPGILPFVASGPRGAIGHATWMGRTIQPGELVFLETAGCIRRYHTAMMRGVCVGQPSEQLLKAEDLVIEAVEATIAAVKPGMTAAEADAVNRKILAKADFGGTQSTRSAYPIGIAVPPDWGEGQILSFLPTENRVLEAGMTFHLIPWVQISGAAGVGCSETILITENGCEALTNFERKLFVK
jgi:Xaa-Pro dipeptidase